MSSVGDSVWLIALAWTAVHVAGPAQAGLLIGIGTLPRALLLLLGGALADRMDAWRTVVIANAVRALLMLAGAAALGMTDNPFPVLIAVALAFGIADALHNPAVSTMPRQMVRREDLGPLMGLFQTTSRVARLIGAPLGGVLVAAYGLRATMVVNAASFAVIGLVYFFWVRPRIARQLSTGRSVRHDLVSGLGYVRRTPVVRTLVVALSGLNLFVGPAIAVGLALRVSDEGWGAHSLGWLEACVGGGAAVGALAATRWRPRRPARTGFIALVAQGAAIAAFGLGPRASVAAATVLVGVTAGLASAFLSGAFQATVAEEFLGRTSSLTALADDGLMPLAMMGFGLVAATTSVTVACVAAGAGMAGLCAWSGSRESIRRLTAEG